jgi:hypothetical protein
MTPPQNEILVLTEEEIKSKFHELGMLAFLSMNCERRSIKRNTKCPAQRRYTAERGVTFLRKSDGGSQAIVYYWRTPDGDEDFRVPEFTAPDGTFYTTDVITHPSHITADTTTII